MIEVQLIDNFGGWGYMFAPDDIEIEVESEGRRKSLTLSGQDLLLVYDRLSQQKQDAVVLGMGHTLGISFPDSSRVHIQFSEIEMTASRAQLSDEIEALLQSVFEENDSVSTGAERTQALSDMQGWLDARDATLTVEELYQTLC
ncbi:hypothetical protein [Halorubellus litoreus]|uniref:Uncharacterized protein n=1 Tax=Halorubellus litoreus TaxID=755308 RepID=A0ABD5VH52_9EURY